MRRLTIAVLAGMVALVGACSGGGDDPDAAPSSQTTDSTASTDAGATDITSASDPRSGESIATVTVQGVGGGMAQGVPAKRAASRSRGLLACLRPVSM